MDCNVKFQFDCNCELPYYIGGCTIPSLPAFNEMSRNALENHAMELHLNHNVQGAHLNFLVSQGTRLNDYQAIFTRTDAFHKRLVGDLHKQIEELIAEKDKASKDPLRPNMFSTELSFQFRPEKKQLEAKVKELERELMDAQSTMSELRAIIHVKDDEVPLLSEEQFSRLVERMTHGQAVEEELVTKLENMKEGLLTYYQTEMPKVNDERKRTLDDIGKYQAEVAQLESQVHDLTRQRDELTQAAAKNAEISTEHEQKAQKLQGFVAQLQQALRQCQNRVKMEQDHAKSQFDEAKVKHQQMHQQLEQAREESVAAQNMKSKLVQLENENRQLRAALEQANVQGMRSKFEQLAQENQQLRAKVHQAQAKPQSDVTTTNSSGVPTCAKCRDLSVFHFVGDLSQHQKNDLQKSYADWALAMTLLFFARVKIGQMWDETYSRWVQHQQAHGQQIIPLGARPNPVQVVRNAAATDPQAIPARSQMPPSGFQAQPLNPPTQAPRPQPASTPSKQKRPAPASTEEPGVKRQKGQTQRAFASTQPTPARPASARPPLARPHPASGAHQSVQSAQNQVNGFHPGAQNARQASFPHQHQHQHQHNGYAVAAHQNGPGSPFSHHHQANGYVSGPGQNAPGPHFSHEHHRSQVNGFASGPSHAMPRQNLMRQAQGQADMASVPMGPPMGTPQMAARQQQHAPTTPSPASGLAGTPSTGFTPRQFNTGGFMANGVQPTMSQPAGPARQLVSPQQGQVSGAGAQAPFEAATQASSWPSPSEGPDAFFGIDVSPDLGGFPAPGSNAWDEMLDAPAFRTPEQQAADAEMFRRIMDD